MKIEEGLYQHYKGNYYSVIGQAKHSETLEDLIIYKALYYSDFGIGAIWARPLSMFLEQIEVDGKMIPRFKKIENEMK